MKKIIHNLKKQPENVRRQVLHLVVFIFGILLILLWTFSLGRDFSNEKTKEEMEQDLQPFTLLKESLFQE